MARPPCTIDEKTIRRFDGRNTVFARMRTDRSLPFYGQSMYSRTAEAIARGGPGRTRVDLEEAMSSWTVHDYFRGGFGDEKLGEPDSVMAEPARPRHEFASPAEAAARLKAAALRLGACAAGAARANPLWIYSHNSRGETIELPTGVEHALVMCVPMDREGISKSPGFEAAAATGRAYSMMALVASSIAEMIRRLGYRAVSCGNGTALSVPLAVDAGLGVMGRSGMLLTRERGPCVRICKVFTDLPLAPDEPERADAGDPCKKCRACARACPAGAISDAEEPGYETLNASNRPGVLRWAVDAEKCYAFWVENGADCSNCIAACPYQARKGRGETS